MSGTPSRPPSTGVAVAFAVITSACLALMVVFPAEDTIPYHLIYLSVTIIYAVAVWPFQRALLLLLFVATTTGVVLVQGALEGVVDWHETSEAVLMPAIFLGMLWHSQRQIRAQHQIEILAVRQQALLEAERASLQDTTHAIRAPVTVARGHVSLVMDAVDNLTVLEDLGVVVEQLDRISRLAASLLALHELDESRHAPRVVTDVADLVKDVVRRWSSAVDRDWAVEVPAGAVALIDEHRLELSVDALIENAVKFTEPGGRVLVSVSRRGTSVVVAVDDSGPGIPVEHRAAVFDRFWTRRSPSGVEGTGLGLALVRAVAETHSGSVAAGSSALGGARVSMALPARVTQPSGSRPARV